MIECLLTVTHREHTTRREFLSGLAIGGSVGLSGCIGPLDNITGDNGNNPEPSIKIVKPDGQSTVPPSFVIEVEVENFDLTGLDEDSPSGHIDLSWSEDSSIEEGDTVPFSEENKHFGNGPRSRKIELPGQGEYTITAVLSDEDHVATQYKDSVDVSVVDPDAYIEVFMNSDGNEAYTSIGADSNGLSGNVFPNNGLDENPDIRLNTGDTYRFVLGSTAQSHPIEFRDSDDELLASMSEGGQMEESIEWEIVSDGIVEFTPTEEFMSRVDSYNCANHPDNMQGSILS